MSSAIDNDRFRKLLDSYPDAAVEQLYVLLRKRLVAYSFTLTKDRDASKDIVQDSFLSLLADSKRLNLQEKRSIENYLIGIVRNKSISFFKGRRRHLDLEELLITASNRIRQSQNSMETSIIEEEIIKQAREHIASFPDRERECFLLLIDHNLKLDEIALRMNVTRKAVEANITRSRKRLKNWGNGL